MNNFDKVIKYIDSAEDISISSISNLLDNMSEEAIINRNDIMFEQVSSIRKSLFRTMGGLDGFYNGIFEIILEFDEIGYKNLADCQRGSYKQLIKTLISQPK